MEQKIVTSTTNSSIAPMNEQMWNLPPPLGIITEFITVLYYVSLTPRPITMPLQEETRGGGAEGTI